MRQFELYFLMFAALSVAGWLMEVACKYIEFGRFINRGFLVGPYCPIYGVGAVLVTLLLDDLKDTPAAVFFLAMLVSGALEYLTGYIMEKLFHARWWDYSSRRFNINGRVCLDTLIPFGLMSLLLVYLIKPLLFSLFSRINEPALHAICIVIAAIFAADIIISGHILKQIRSSADSSAADDTETLTRAVRAELAKKGILLRRYMQAFPYMRLYSIDILKKIKEKRLLLEKEAREFHSQLRKRYNK